MSMSLRERLALARIGAALSRDDPRLARMLSVQTPAHRPPGDAEGPDSAPYGQLPHGSRHDLMLALVGVFWVLILVVMAALWMNG